MIRAPLRKFPIQALLCTELDAEPQQIITWFILRWQLEVTFHAVRTPLGVQTQHQWSHRTILRTSPAAHGALLARYAAVARLDAVCCPMPILRHTAWYRKTHSDLRRCHRPGASALVDPPAFSDIALRA